jgi:aminoglycoside phosphotransferase (APT) family kinase protein
MTNITAPASSEISTRPMDEFTPCTACSWTKDQQDHCSYKSNLKLFHAASDHGLWWIGSKLVLKEISSKRATAEPATIRSVARHTSIPVPAVVADWTEPADGARVMLTERMPGTTLDEAWPRLSANAKERAAAQTAALLQQLRPLHAPRIQNVAGGPVYDAFLFAGNGSEPHGPFASDDELWAAMEQALVAAQVPAAVCRRLRARMPPAGPYTLTHGAADTGNVLVDDDGNVTCILDWEDSGYFPVWYEFATTSIAFSKDDLDWKCRLRRYMESYNEAREWYLDWIALSFPRRDPMRAEKLLRETDDE